MEDKWELAKVPLSILVSCAWSAKAKAAREGHSEKHHAPITPTLAGSAKERKPERRKACSPTLVR
jgi:hypothetical protein